MYNSELASPAVQTVSPPKSISDPAMEDCWSDLDEPVDSLGPPGSPAITSRLSVQKISSVVSRFSKFKCAIVKDIGFGGALETQPWQKLNLKLSAWLLDRVDIDTATLNIEGQVPLGIYDQDVERIFSLPCGKTTIGTDGVEPSEACMEYTRFASNFSDKGIHSLKAAEACINREINEDSPAIEVDCFKIVFIIYFVGNVLAPSAKHDYITVDFWAAINDPSRIKEWNWYGYVIKHLFAAVQKFKADVAKRNNTIHIVGNHLFLQLMMFDMLELGPLTRATEHVPRVGLYDYEVMKKIVDMISVNIGGDTSFHGGNFKGDAGPAEVTPVCAQLAAAPAHRQGVQKKANMPCSPMLRASYAKIGANDFANHIKTKYPSISGEKLGILLREHNAKSLTNIADIRQHQQLAMFSFVDKLMACIAEHCTCCKSAGRRQCVLKVQTNTPANPYRTPVADKIGSLLAPFTNELADSSEATSPPTKRRWATTSSGGMSSVSCKQRRIQVAQPLFDNGQDAVRLSATRTDGFKPASPLAAKIIVFLDDLAASIVTKQAELRLPEHYHLFGQTTKATPVMADIAACGFAKNPWSLGSCPPGPSRTAAIAIQDWMARASQLVLQRNWILHSSPRFVFVDGQAIVDQLVNKSPISHELFVVIMRRYGQIDKAHSKDAPRMRWRKFLEPDFATAVLSNADPMTIQAVHELFAGYQAEFEIASTRMWFVPAVLDDGWVVYMYDMLMKRIQVLDPSVGPFGFSTERVQIHEYVSTKLLGALFHCLGKFFTSWMCTTEKWTRAFPIIMSDKFTRDESGLCATFLAKHYDGDKLLLPLNQDNLAAHKQNTLYDVLRLEGNESYLPADALEAIKISFCVL